MNIVLDDMQSSQHSSGGVAPGKRQASLAVSTEQVTIVVFHFVVIQCIWSEDFLRASQGPSSPSGSSTSSGSSSQPYSDMELDDVQGQLFEYAIDQYGSRFLQQRISTADEIELEAAFKELRPYLRELSTHVFGNYIVQKVLEYGSYQQLGAIVHSFRGRWHKLSLDLYGCRVVQKAINLLPDIYKV